LKFVSVYECAVAGQPGGLGERYPSELRHGPPKSLFSLGHLPNPVTAMSISVTGEDNVLSSVTGLAKKTA
jgi:hypothetical protein